MSETIGNRIRIARKKAGLTQAQISQKAFISESYMALIELDKRNPSTDVVVRIAEILNVSSDHLLFGDAEKNDTVLFNEWKKLMNNRSENEIESAHEVVRCFFRAIDNK